MTVRPWVIVVGGFLGAGKTTLLLAAAQELERRSLRSAVILNDQGTALVDSEYARLHDLPSREVTGGCFCCRFSELVDVMNQLRAHAPDVILTEPVGSCTDIAATVLQPLYEFSQSWRIAPLTVLVDPERALALLRDDAEPHLGFLFRNQLEEADLLCFTKSDIYSEFPEIKGRSARQISARSGQGVAAWLDESMAGTLSAGTRLLDIDYEQYARAEAALAWLNLQVTIRPETPLSPPVVLGPLFDCLQAKLSNNGVSIVHLKGIIQAETGFVKAALCANDQQLAVEGNLDSSPAATHELLVNLRAVGDAAKVQSIVENCLQQMGHSLSDLEIACFHPAPPTPERRVTKASVPPA